MSINRLGKFREIYMDFDGSVNNDNILDVDFSANITGALYKESVLSWNWWSSVEIATGWNTVLQEEYFYDFDKLIILDDASFTEYWM